MSTENRSSPLVSIAVPVYNGQRYLRDTIDSILNQTFTDFELILCDNCSTDATAEICREYVQRDARVRYYRADTNLGPARNYNRAVEYARGRYFKWNAADDLCAPTFIEKCVAMLESDPTLILAYPRTIQIGTHGEHLHHVEYQPQSSHRSPWQRLRKLLFVNHRHHGAHELFGVMRLEWLRHTTLCGSYVRADSVLLAKLAMIGRFGCVEEFLFLNRDHADRSSRTNGRRYARPDSNLSAIIGSGPLPPAEWWEPTMKGRIVFPEWRVMVEYARAIHEAWLPPLAKMLCFLTFGVYAVCHVPKLGRDLLIAAEQAIRRSATLDALNPAEPTAATRD